MKYILILFVALIVTGCGHKKLVAKNCEQAANSGIFVCDPL